MLVAAAIGVCREPCGTELQPEGVVGHALSTNVDNPREEVENVVRDADPGCDLKGAAEGGRQAAVEEHDADLGETGRWDIEELADPEVKALRGEDGGRHVPNVPPEAQVLVSEDDHYGEGCGEGLWVGLVRVGRDCLGVRILDDGWRERCFCLDLAQMERMLLSFRSSVFANVLHLRKAELGDIPWRRR